MTALGAREGALGLLRSERRLASRADARAAALDPLTPPELAELLRRSRPDPHGDASDAR